MVGISRRSTMNIAFARIASTYVVALGSVFVTLVLKSAVPVIGEAHPFVLLSVPIIVSAYYGGLGPGAAATPPAPPGAGALFITSPAFGVDGYPGGLFALCLEGVLISAITVAL